MRTVAEIKAAGAAYVTEAELASLCDQIVDLEKMLNDIVDCRTPVLPQTREHAVYLKSIADAAIKHFDERN